MSRLSCILILLLLNLRPVAAHDLWLVPPGGILPVSRPITLRAVSGMKFPVGDVAPDPAKFTQLRAWSPDGMAVDLTAAGKEGNAGLLQFTPTQAGCWLVTVQTSPRTLEMSASDFNRYLVSDGLAHVFLERAEHRQLEQTAKERYSKSPKALVQVGNSLAGDPTRPLGLPLEIVPLENPLQKKAGEALRVRVLFRGQPLAEANLGWDYPGPESSPRGTARTNRDGEALIPLEKPGLMAIRLTHMTRPRHPEFEWESFWTSFTFEIPETRRN